jgi:prevent-host-death family protein
MWSHGASAEPARLEQAMSERRIGIRELKAKLSECVREVRAGRAIVVTERGRPVARLIPDAASVRDRLASLKTAGGIQWSGRRLTRTKPVVRLRGRRTVADLVSENRE